MAGATVEVYARGEAHLRGNHVAGSEIEAGEVGEGVRLEDARNRRVVDLDAPDAPPQLRSGEALSSQIPGS